MCHAGIAAWPWQRHYKPGAPSRVKGIAVDCMRQGSSRLHDVSDLHPTGTPWCLELTGPAPSQAVGCIDLLHAEHGHHAVHYFWR